jgi:hypothetical protein
VGGVGVGVGVVVWVLWGVGFGFSPPQIEDLFSSASANAPGSERVQYKAGARGRFLVQLT